MTTICFNGFPCCNFRHLKPSNIATQHTRLVHFCYNIKLLCILSGGIFYAAVSKHFMFEPYNSRVVAALDSLVKEGLWTWIVKGEQIQANGYIAVAWILRIC